MEVQRINYQDIPALDPSVACIGYFDGMHKGHQELLNLSLKIAKTKKLKSAVITFDPDPWSVFILKKSYNTFLL